jgi:hypothetical protein
MSYVIRYDGDDHEGVVEIARALGKRQFYVEVQVSNQPRVAGFLHGVVDVAGTPYLLLAPVQEPVDEDEGPMPDLFTPPVLIDPDHVHDLHLL